jgi:perosamine synthetase
MIKKFVAYENDPLNRILEVIDANTFGVAFIVKPDWQLCGVVTDGDIRRALLDGKGLKCLASEVMVSDPISLPVDTDHKTVFGKLDQRVRIIPLLDDDGRLVDYATSNRPHQIPVAEPSLSGREYEYVTECLDTNWISSQGKFIGRFESEFGEFIGSDHALAVTNGTAALHLALAALGIGPGDEVLVPDLTFAASAAAVIFTGATPVLVDIESESWGIDVTAAAELITERTAAIMPVHLYGQPSNMDEVIEFARKHNIFVVEDAAESLGSTYRGQHTGTFGDAGIFSFFGNKLITTGEGGMVVFKDAEVAERAKCLRDHGMNPERRYWHDVVGFNYRLTNIQAAIGVAQLEKIDVIIENKLSVAEQYKTLLADLPHIKLPPDLPDTRNINWAFSILIDSEAIGVSRDRFMNLMAIKGIDTRPIFHPLHEMPPYAPFGGNRPFDVSVSVSNSGVSLPSFTALTSEQINFIGETIRQILDTNVMRRELIETDS